MPKKAHIDKKMILQKPQRHIVYLQQCLCLIGMQPDPNGKQSCCDLLARKFTPSIPAVIVMVRKQFGLEMLCIKASVLVLCIKASVLVLCIKASVLVLCIKASVSHQCSLHLA
jgi:hypothetical protein